jgi:hypothetical protein
MGSLALAAYGAVGGAGQGMQEVAQTMQKQQLIKQQNDMEQQRQEALERLRAANEQSMQKTGIEAQQAAQKAQFGEEEKITGTKIGAASAAAGATRQFEAEQNKAKLASEEKRTERTAESRENVAGIRASASQSSGKGGAQWELHNINVGQPMKSDGKGGMIPDVTAAPTQKSVLFNKSTGATYTQVGDKFIRYDTDKNAPAYSPNSLARVPAAQVQDLLKDPYAVIPSGYSNSGMTKLEAFEQQFHYLPAGVTSAMQSAQQNQRSSASSSLPLGLVRGIGGPNASSTKQQDLPAPPEPEEPEPPTAEEAPDNSPPFQSQAMGVYGNVAQ